MQRIEAFSARVVDADEKMAETVRMDDGNQQTSHRCFTDFWYDLLQLAVHRHVEDDGSGKCA